MPPHKKQGQSHWSECKSEVEALKRSQRAITAEDLCVCVVRETDGRWIADIPALPGVTVYGSTPERATLRAKALALRVIAEEIEHDEFTKTPQVALRSTRPS